MCTAPCIEFGIRALQEEKIESKEVLEMGSRNVNGSLRSYVESLGPAQYLGVDIQDGPGVDYIQDVTLLLDDFGSNAFDYVISTELLEHTKNWRKVIHVMKNIVKPGGVILITTRSKGFQYHGYPCDYWRYEENDMVSIFSDCSIEMIERDSSCPGIFVKIRKPNHFCENDLREYRLFSVVTNRNVCDISSFDMKLFFAWRYIAKKMPEPLKKILKRKFFS